MTSPDFRQSVQKTFNLIDAALAKTDPDIAECEQSQGALTITFTDKSRLILSTQPTVRQIWLAVSAKAVAYHFNYDPETSKWLDDKGHGIELLKFIKNYLKESVDIVLEDL